MRVDAFDFELPEERIALRPARPRDSARLLEVRHGALEHRHVGDLPSLLRPGDVCVFNDTRVIHAQLEGRRAARAEAQQSDIVAVEPKLGVTLHKRMNDDTWWVFAKPGRRLRPGDTIRFGAMTAEVMAKEPDGNIMLRFSIGGAALDAAIAELGTMPLPPYIASKRAPGDDDETDYQTIFADRDGSVAAPTAGLHFTPALLDGLKAQGVQSVHITLHVGAGTFLPVKADDTGAHRMHSEWGEITAEAAEKINAAKKAGGRIVAIGTTSLRLLESAAGADGTVYPFAGETDIFITPGYQFRAVDVLWTNFHLPRSTLYILVAAFAGLDVTRAAYEAAIVEKYRFYSFGDATLFHRAAP